MITHFDHTYSYLKENDLDASLSRFQRAGFLLHEHKMRHPAGHLNGFISMTGTYLEFVSVVDEAEFEAEATDDDRIFRKNPQPFAFGAVCLDPDTIHRNLKSHYPDLEPPYSRGEKNNPEGPIRWTFCPMPSDAMPGANMFPLKYHARGNKADELKQGPNSIFALTGIALVSNDIRSRVDTWEKTLKASCLEVERKDSRIHVGFQAMEWVSPEEYRTLFGSSWVLHNSPNAEIGAICLSAESLDCAADYLSKENFEILWDKSQNVIRTKRDEKTGYTFVIREGSPQAVLQELNRLIGL